MNTGSFLASNGLTLLCYSIFLRAGMQGNLTIEIPFGLLASVFAAVLLTSMGVHENRSDGLRFNLKLTACWIAGVVILLPLLHWGILSLQPEERTFFTAPMELLTDCGTVFGVTVSMIGLSILGAYGDIRKELCPQLA
ncbi:MAG: hypothetical protein JWM39_464 [Parcubacteria group bacterium]|nr:hypothetical protein [Parcubacteria group bacterium]